MTPSTKGPDLEIGAPPSQPDQPIPDAAAIRSQLDSLLASPHFRNSKRCQALLRYVVEACLEGELDKVKERTIGSQVFRREPGYDTNQDSVVRTTAAETRKRLAQYYMEPEHEHELRVSLHQGSYVPDFRFSAPVLPAALPAIEPAPEPARRVLRPAGFAAIAVLGILSVLGVVAYAYYFHQNELDVFWAPLVDDHADAVISIGQPRRVYIFEGPRVDELNSKMVGENAVQPPPDEVRRNTLIPLTDLRSAGDRYLSTGNAMATVRVAELLGRKHKPFHVLGDRDTTYNDLRGRPAVLIGQFDNQWTAGLTRSLRYYLVRSSETRSYEVRDRNNHDAVVGSASRDPDRPEEYVIITRVFDPSTEKLVIAIAGMTFNGTLAGGDFLTTPEYIHDAYRNAPSGWKRINSQVVLKSTMVAGNAGPPKVVATYFW
jgi:hypothetical protein